MNVSQFQPKCEKIRSYFDSYLCNELLIETNHEVLKHLEACPECSSELGTRARLRNGLHQAVRKQPIPAGLEERIRNRIRARSSGSRFRSPHLQWALAAAAA